MKEVYQNFEGQIIAGELVPTKDDVRKLNDQEYVNANPFVKKCCADCSYLVSYRSWWCTNKGAKEARGTAIPGIAFCPFWEPNWKQMPDKYKIAEYGYVPPIPIMQQVVQSWWDKLKALWHSKK